MTVLLLLLPFHMQYSFDIVRDLTTHVGRIIYFHVIKININKA
jgi:hypothetical protein